MKRYKAFRLKNKQYRNKCRKANYHRGRPPLKKAKRRSTGVIHGPWMDTEVAWLMDWSGIILDRTIAKVLGRSVQAIQQKRYKINADKR